ncbi:hypothetical protein IAQ61_003989 [Plenodomus lingam]|uniref:uncharacterized protein n=1 Tax=Leptosphaeria maculans TaxID=5022 RepID=UPI00332CF64D|nr:hypothetical protein IAQ61_003989 [Plenodomus lingam]
MAARSISTLAWAKTSAEADMLTRKSMGAVWSAALVLRHLITPSPPIHLQNSQLRFPSFLYPPFTHAKQSHPFLSTIAREKAYSKDNLPCTVAFAPSEASAPMVPTMKYWNTLGPVSPPLFLYAANEGIFVESGLWLLKGLSKLEAEAARVWMAVQPARATGNWCAVHERAIARVLVARTGIVKRCVRAVRAGGGGGGGWVTAVGWRVLCCDG